MPNFIVTTDTQSGGVHHVHDENSICKHMPSHEHRRSLGWFSTSQGAIAEAKKTFANVNGCKYCAN